jgi:hypothetical protein
VTASAPSSEYQVTYWRDLPSMVVARAGEQVTKVPLAGRFQAAIDEAAMRLGDVGSVDYLAGWQRGEWTAADGSTTDIAGRVVAELEESWPPDRLLAYLDTLGPTETQT